MICFPWKADPPLFGANGSETPKKNSSRAIINKANFEQLKKKPKIS